MSHSSTPAPIIKETHIVPAATPKTRLSDYAAGIFQTIPTRKGIKKAIKRGEVWVDGQPAETGWWVEPGQRIDLMEPEPAFKPVYKHRLEVVYQDDHLALINKPGGLPVSGNFFKNLENALPYNLQPSVARDALPHPLPAHRLDGPTCGLLLVAKTRSARVDLGRQFEDQSIKKRYRAIAIGNLSEEGTIEVPIDSQKAKTVFRTIERVPSLKNEFLSLADLWPQTGRTHQLRIHLADLGHPILGDRLYGKKGLILRGKGLFLCATGLNLRHPASQEELEFNISEPPKFQLLLEREKRRWEKYNK